MKIIMKLLPVFALVLIFSCAKKADSITLTGKIENASRNKVVLTSHATGYDADIELDENGAFTTEIPLTEAGYIRFRNGRQYGNIYAKPGDAINFSVDAKKFEETLAFSGDSKAENDFLAKQLQFNKENSSMLGFEAMWNLKDESSFKKINEERQTLWTSFIDDNASGLNKQFVELERKKVTLKGLSARFDFPQSYKNANKTEPELSNNYYAFLDDFDINEEGLVKTEEGFFLIQSIIRHKNQDLDYRKSGPIDYFLGLYDRAREQISNKKVKEALLYSYLSQKLSFGGGLDGITDELDYFKSISDNPVRLAKIDELVGICEKLKRGADAPQFSGVTSTGEKVNLADLKGKNVYVDVWATWCGPCKAEIPSLKKVEQEYHDGNIEFVSISVDEQKDKEKWAKFIVDNDLGGMQLFANGAWESDITKGYNIKGIPRFILINDKGKIYSADAPRPSQHENLSKAFKEMGVLANSNKI